MDATTTPFARNPSSSEVGDVGKAVKKGERVSAHDFALELMGVSASQHLKVG